MIEVPWRGGARARVAHGPYQWILDNVPEATTPESRATLYELGAKLCTMLAHCRMAASGDFPLESEKAMRAKREKGCAAVVVAWDALMAAMDAHPTYRGDQVAACERLGVDMAEAEKYAIALRAVIDGYRPLQGIRRGGAGARGRHGGVRRAFLASVATEIQRTLAVSEDRAASIVAGMASLDGERASVGSIRLAMRQRRL
jgi:hypothetical protein